VYVFVPCITSEYLNVEVDVRTPFTVGVDPVAEKIEILNPVVPVPVN